MTSSTLPPRLELGRWRLRELREADACAWAAYLADPVVTEHTSWPPIDEELVRGLVERSIAGYRERTSCRCAVASADDDRLVGTCGFSTWSDQHGTAELVYDLAPSHWGRGIMRSAAGALVDWAFGAGLTRVQAAVMPANLPSIRLLEALGFEREALLRSYRRSHGVPADFYLYARFARRQGRAWNTR